MEESVNKQIMEELSNLDPDLECSCKTPRHLDKIRRVDDAMDALSSRMASKLEEVVRLACGNDSIAEHSPAALQSLKKKHPNPHTDPLFISLLDAVLCFHLSGGCQENYLFIAEWFCRWSGWAWSQIAQPQQCYFMIQQAHTV